MKERMNEKNKLAAPHRRAQEWADLWREQDLRGNEPAREAGVQRGLLCTLVASNKQAAGYDTHHRVSSAAPTSPAFVTA